MFPSQTLNMLSFLVINIHISPHHIGDQMGNLFFTYVICCEMHSLEGSHGVKMSSFHYLPK
jgi:hypothetical protein